MTLDIHPFNSYFDNFLLFLTLHLTYLFIFFPLVEAVVNFNNILIPTARAIGLFAWSFIHYGEPILQKFL